MHLATGLVISHRATLQIKAVHRIVHSENLQGGEIKFYHTRKESRARCGTFKQWKVKVITA